ncbi:MAG: CinA family nicotinamide mononucleotide deamidase-related protein [Phycisphaerales bacterium JB037]
MTSTGSHRPHRTAAILAIGDELILGQKLDSNSQWLSARLLDLGIRPVEHATVDDDLDQIAGAFTRLARVADLILCTGGLGPTADDLTRQGLARAMGEELVEDAGALAQIRAWYDSRGRAMPEPNRVQALRPQSAAWISNEHGTAPGLVGEIEREDARATAVCLPGPPREMHPMFEVVAREYLRPAEDRVTITKILQTFGTGESNVAEMLGELMARDRMPLVGTTASTGIVSVRIRYEGTGGQAAGSPPREQAQRLVDETEQDVRGRLGPLVFGEGEDATLEGHVLGLLRARGQMLATVESCTGGMVGGMLTSVAGSSDAYAGGWVTYTNAMKHKQVGVPREVFEGVPGSGEPAAGAVSAECARAMAEGGLRESGVDHCVAITGIAGPGGGSDEKPVGLVWIALASMGSPTDVRRFRFKGGRDQIRLWAARSALGMVRLRVEGVEMGLLGEG